MFHHNTIYQLRATINDNSPLFWLRIQMPMTFKIVELLVQIQYAKMVIKREFPQIDTNFINGMDIHNKNFENHIRKINLDNSLCDIFKSELISKEIPSLKKIKYYKVDLEMTFIDLIYSNYPLCVYGYMLLNSKIEMRIPKIYFINQTISAKKFHEIVFKNNNSSKKENSKSVTKFEFESKNTLSLWHLWIIKMIQGGFSKSELIQEFDKIMLKEDVVELYDCILNDSLKSRCKALCILSFCKGIPQRVISKYLCVNINTLRYYISKYKQRGVKGLIEHKIPKEIKKYEDQNYKREVFSILHSPPAEHGFNRTTWKIGDIKQVMDDKGLHISKGYIGKIITAEGYKVTKARKKLTSNDPNYREILNNIKSILSNLKNDERFFSIDEYGPFAIKVYGGRSLTPPGEKRTVPQWQKNKGSLIITAALELSTNQITHFYSKKKNTEEMIKLLNILIEKYHNEKCIYFSWDAASWHASKKLQKRVDEINSHDFKQKHKSPFVKLAPLPSCAQFLNVIESVFSGMAKAIIHNSSYQSVDECMLAIDRYYKDRNEYFKENPKRAGNKIWGKEREKVVFDESNNCKDPAYR